MPDPDIKLLAVARARKFEDHEFQGGWDLLIRGIELGWIDRGELGEILSYLSRGDSFISEELGFEPQGLRLRIWFLDDEYFCESEAFIQQLSSLC